MNNSPIEQWHSLVCSHSSVSKLATGLQVVYTENRPTLAEILVESFCPSSCRHCIYPPDYHLFNRTLKVEQWEHILDKLHNELGFKTFIFGGRRLSKRILRLVAHIKNNFPQSLAGIIADCRDVEPLLADLVKKKPDWIDISVDGLAGEHDLQRGQQGAFAQVLLVLQRLREVAPETKINILPCLTTINLSSVVEMMVFFNRRGFKNFFISPVTVYENQHPDPGLVPDDKNFIRFIADLKNKLAVFEDAWVEINLYDITYVSALKRLWPDLYNRFSTEGFDHLEYREKVADSELYINYYPVSLNGINELIVNSNGDVIPPMVMALGKIEAEMIFANLLRNKCREGFFAGLLRGKAFSLYVAQLLQEYAVLQ